MYLVLGLGNYGTKYQLHRHNIGFMIVDAIAKIENATSFNKGQRALVSKCQLEGEKVILAKPQTYMNLSGDSTQELLTYYKIPVEKLIVVQDEIELDFGRIKVQKARGHAGHNGIRDIHQKLGTNNYTRLKFGVSRPSNARMDVADYLLQDFNNEEQSQLVDLLGPACDCVSSFIKNGYEKTANIFNQKGNKS